jgi:exopolysaccharide biosynthesis predicted pyruvyltransferase EpsI
LENEQARSAIKRLTSTPSLVYFSARSVLSRTRGHPDRLHGHILCLLLNIPHVFLNDDSGKNWNFHETWTRDAELCRLARTPAEAWTLARNGAAKLKELGMRASWSWDGLE